jgi:hypothetical protein
MYRPSCGGRRGKDWTMNEEQDVFELGKVFAASGYFQDAREAAQATVKILAGRELGLPPFASMTGIHIIKGKPALGANLIAARIKASGKYNYRIIEHTDQVCRIAFFEGSEQVGVSEFTLADARKAGTQNLERYPKNMLFARALTNGARWYTPDLFVTGVYTPEEMGANVDSEGEVVSLPAPQQTPPPSALPAPRGINRERALARIAELGGDVTHAARLSDEELVAYGKELRLPPPDEGEGDSAPPAPPPAPPAQVSITGFVVGEQYVSDKVCRFSVLNDEGETHKVTVFPQRTCWHQVISHDGRFVVGDDERIVVSGKVQFSEKYGESILADAIKFEAVFDEEEE